MVREVLNKFSGGQLTVIIVAAILCPTAVGAAVSFQSVVVVDPTTGKQSYVDNGRRLGVYDPIAGYRNNPANLVTISGEAGADGNSQNLYTVPAGKALILTSTTQSYYGGVSGNDNFFYCYRLTPSNTYVFSNFDDIATYGTHHSNFGTGVYLRSGDILHCFGSNGSNASMRVVFNFEGFLVPNTAVPAASAQVSAEQEVQVGSGKPRSGFIR